MKRAIMEIIWKTNKEVKDQHLFILRHFVEIREKGGSLLLYYRNHAQEILYILFIRM